MTNQSKQAASDVAELLNSYAKGGAGPAEIVKLRLMDFILAGVPSLDQSVASYRAICDEFLIKTIAVKGIPTETISGENTGEIRSSSGKSVAADFQKLLPLLKERYAWCIKIYETQAKKCFEQYISEIGELIDKFLTDVPQSTKERTSSISNIKREIRYFAKWGQLLYTHRAMSFPSEVQYVFIMNGSPIAAVWQYNIQDEQCEFPPTVDHKLREGRVYAVRGNWAEAKGLMVPGPYGYIDEVDRPHQETGCMCYLHWLYSIDSLPTDMLTAQGRDALCLKSTMEPDTSTTPSIAKKASGPTVRKSWLSRLLSGL